MHNLIYTPLVILLILSHALAKNINTINIALPSVVTVYATNDKNIQDVDSIIKSVPSKNIVVASGVVIGANNLIVTNQHVIQDRGVIAILLQDGRIIKANLLAHDKNIDLALLRLDNDKISLQPITISKDKQNIGEDVFAIGNPFGIGISVSSGIISALPRTNGIISNLGNLIQTDAAVNPGSSGGALIDTKGHLIGINTALFSRTGNFAGISFSIPINVVTLFVERSLEGKKVKEYWLGLSGVNVDYKIAKQLGMEIPQGVFITTVYEGHSAAHSDLKKGDIIISLNNENVNSIADLNMIVANINNSTDKEIKIIRNNKEISKIIKPELIETYTKKDILNIEKGIFQNTYFANSSISLAMDLGMNIPKDAVVVYSVGKDSFLARLGIKKGDILISINNKKVENVSQIEKLLKSKAKNQFIFSRNNNFITINIGT